MRLFLILLFFPLMLVAQQTDTVDFQQISALIVPDSESKMISGQMETTFVVKRPTDSVYLDAIDIKLTDWSTKAFRIATDDKKIWFVGNFEPGRSYKANFWYEAVPKQTVYFTEDQTWTQGQGKYTSHWLPSIDDMNDKIEFDLAFKVPNDAEVVTNGKLVDEQIIDNQKLWFYDMDQPMSSYLAAFAIGDFDKIIVTSESGIPIELYYRPEDSLKAEPTYRYTREIFDFLENEIGVSYPWQNYKQVPVRDFLYAGMENTTATIFSEAFVVDSIGFNDRNYINVNAHELAHHWFGNLVTEASGTHHWLQEGFATYYAQLAEREIFGEDYFYWKLYQTAEQLKELSDQGKGEVLLNPNASSLTFYEKGAWALHMLRKEIGETAFRETIKQYLTKFSYENSNTDDFLHIVRSVTEVDISKWETDWLEQSAFQSAAAFDFLSESEFMNSYFELFTQRKAPFSERINALAAAIDSENDYLGQEAVFQLADQDMNTAFLLYKRALESDNIYIRQAVALSIPTVTEKLKPLFELLLTDDSYLTREAALYTLWRSFPLEQHSFLDKTDGMTGFQDKNIRQLWLALAVFTKGYQEDNRDTFITELKSYCSPQYSFEIRKKAFEYINELQLYDEVVVDNLVNAAVHHQWRFRNFARGLLDELLKGPGLKEALEDRLEQYSEREQKFLKPKLTSE